MKITVVGSTSRIGRHILTEGPRRGHEITAFTRRPHVLTDADTLTAVVHGDARDPQAVAGAVAGADAVIAIVAAASRKGPHHTAEVSRVITEAMADAGVRRFVITNPYPIVADKPRVPIALLRLAFSAAYADAAEMERVVSTQDLDWTIARLNRLIDKPARGTLRITTDLLDKPSSVTRADAAATLLDLAESDDYARSAVNISST
jgi:putative NADH-flavin reductase